MRHFTGHSESALSRRHHLEGRDFRRPLSLPSGICAVHRGQATLPHLAPRSANIRSYQSRSGSGRKQNLTGWAVGTRTSSCCCTSRTARLWLHLFTVRSLLNTRADSPSKNRCKSYSSNLRPACYVSVKNLPIRVFIR